MTDEAATETPAPRQWTRDYEALRGQLDAWLQGQLPADAEPRVSALVVPESNGMSSDTVLFDLSMVEDGERVERPCVARLAPEDTATPVFPELRLPQAVPGHPPRRRAHRGPRPAALVARARQRAPSARRSS